MYQWNKTALSAQVQRKAYRKKQSRRSAQVVKFTLRNMSGGVVHDFSAAVLMVDLLTARCCQVLASARSSSNVWAELARY